MTETDVSKHTPTPWRIRTSGNVGNAIEAYSGKTYGELDDGFRIVASFQECTPSPKFQDQRDNAAANGELIVKAVNAYHATTSRIAELEAALREIVKAVNFRDGVVVAQNSKHEDIMRAVEGIDRAMSRANAALSSGSEKGE